MSRELNSSEKEELKELLKDHPELAVKLHIMERNRVANTGWPGFPKERADAGQYPGCRNN